MYFIIFFSARLTNVPAAPTEIRIKTQAEQIDEMRESVFDLLDRMTEKKEELSEKCVPLSICTQLQQAIRDTEVERRKIIIDFIDPSILSDGYYQNKETK